MYYENAKMSCCFDFDCYLLMSSCYIHFTIFSLQSDNILFIDDENHEFDVLIFTQRWPITGCMEWMDKNKHNECVLPSQKEIWIIHGVWPTRFGSIGPAFCNHDASFNITELEPFENELDQFWINIEKGKFGYILCDLCLLLTKFNLAFVGTPHDSLWKHEWLKHGTCASVLPKLASENKYFGQGLVWLQQFSMSSVLSKSNIVPDDAPVNITDIHKAITDTLTRNPSIHCIQDPKTGELYLDEIRICFSKTLELVDCDGVVKPTIEGTKIIGNCHLDRLIHYPNVVPSTLINRQKPVPSSVWNFPFVNVYKLIQMIKWFTL